MLIYNINITARFIRTASLISLQPRVVMLSKRETLPGRLRQITVQAIKKYINATYLTSYTPPLKQFQPHV